ncbi:hypothetical protein WJX72_009812 [[Myrmecia] bisecta]|uniref:Uncharacterized protein n=1 Tax=[Myrmecia] bisecta TaxID=41462 RepID=A0AAW1R977_9CHLO
MSYSQQHGGPYTYTANAGGIGRGSSWPGSPTGAQRDAFGSGIFSYPTTTSGEFRSDFGSGSGHLEEQLQHSHQDRVLGLTDKLRTHHSLASDEILSVLRSNPLTAPHAEVRAKEIITDLIAADYRSQVQRFSEQLAAKDSEIGMLQREADGLRRSVHELQQQQQGAHQDARRESAQCEHLEAQVAALEKELEQRGRGMQEVTAAKVAADKALSAAQARVTSMQASTSARVGELEQQLHTYRTLAEKKDADMRGFEDAFQQHLAVCGAKTSAWSDREQQLAASQKQAVEMAKALRSELDTVQAALENAVAKADKVERETRQLRKGKAQMLSDMAELEGLLSESEQERKDIRDRYIALGEKVELLLHEEATTKEMAQRNKEAAKLAVQDAVKDLEGVASDCSTLHKKLKDKRRAEKKLAKRLEAAERELVSLRQDIAHRDKELAKATTTIAAYEAKVAALQAREKVLADDLERRKVNKDEIRGQVKREAEDRLKIELKQQSLEYERRIQDLELQNKHFSANELSVSPQDYLPKADHTRILDSRLSSKEAELNGEMHRRLAQCERDWKWKLETREGELQSTAAAKLHQVETEAHAEQKRLSTQVEDLGTELKRLQAQSEALQSQHDAVQKDYGRLKEQTRDYTSVRDAALDQKDEALRQLARAQQQLDERQKQVESLSTQLRSQQRAYEQSLETARQESEGRAGSIVLLEGSLNEERARLASLQAQLADAHAKVAELAEASAKVQQELEAAQKQGGAAELALTALRAEAAALRAALQKAAEDKEKLAAQHKAKLAKMGMQITAKVAALRSQQALLKTAVQGEVSRVSSECSHQMEAIQYKWQQQALLMQNETHTSSRLQGEAKQMRTELLELNGQLIALQSHKAEAEARGADLARKLAQAEEQRDKVDAALAETRARLDACQREKAGVDAKVKTAADDFGAVVATLMAEVPLPLEVQHGLSSSDRHAFADALQRMRREVRNYMDEHALSHALGPIEDSLKGLQRTMSASSPLASPRTPSGTPMGIPKVSPALAMRVERVVQECLSRSNKLREMEGEVTRAQQLLDKMRADSMHFAEAARTEAVAPLRKELEGVKAALADVQQQYETEMAEVRRAAQAAVKQANAEAHSVIEQLQNTATNLQAQLSQEVQRGDELGAEVARMQSEEAGKVRPKPSTVHLDQHDGELQVMRVRVKELEAREQKALRANNAAAAEAQRR